MSTQILDRTKEQIPIRDLLAGRTLTEEDKFEMVAAVLGLCDECRTLFREHVAGDVPLDRIFREEVWNWFGFWSHGRGCPPAGG